MIAGRSATEARDLVRLLQRHPHSIRGLGQHLGVAEDQASALVGDLEEEGLVEQVEAAGVYVIADDEDDRSLPAVWSTTIAGNALAKARLGKPIARRKASELLDELLARAREVNDDAAWLHWVNEVILYGSFATEGDHPVGDLDIAVRLQARFEAEDLRHRQREMIERDGAHPRSMVERAFYAHMKLIRHLRGRSGRIDLVEIDDARPLPPGATGITVYRREDSGAGVDADKLL